MKRTAATLVLIALVVAGCSLKKNAPQAIAGAAYVGGGVILGVVVDDSGSPLPGVTVTLTDRANRCFTATTDALGRYRFVAASPGVHTILAELSGMSPASQRVRVALNESIKVTTRMRLASVAESITVTAEAPLARDPGTYTARPNEALPPGGRRARPVPAQVANTAAVAVTAASPPMPVAAVPPPSMPSIHADAQSLAPQYTPIQEHAFVVTQQQPVTTFSIDVDRASYANVRMFLTRNRMPPPDAVRIEEMINYFTYRLPQPGGADPFTITTEVAGCPWNPSNRLLRIAVQGLNLAEWQTAPNNLVFLLDVSGSMDSPERLPLIKSAMRVLVDQLRAQDTVAIVTYAGAAGLVLPPTSGAHKNTIYAALENLRAGGSTAGGEGIELAYKVARDHFQEGGNNRVILATDGDFNVGISSLDELQTLIEEKRKSGVYLTTVGVGESNYRDSVLELLADKGNGNYAYLDSLKEAEKVFKRELTGTLVAIARDVKIQLELDPSAVESYRQIGYENRALANQDFEDDTKDAGELGAGHSVTALYEFVPRGITAGRNIATVKLRYKLPKSDKSQPIAAVARDTGKTAYDASPDMQFAAAVAEFGMLLRNSPHKGNATFADVLHLATLARGEDLDGLREEFIRLADTARSLSGEVPRPAGGQ